jgi:hypothetical protein
MAAARQTTLEHTAYHEAGHAAASIALGRGLRRVTIVPDSDAGTLGTSANHKMPARITASLEVGSGDAARDWAARQIIIYLAGAVAERKDGGRPTRVGCKGDRAAAADLALAVTSSEAEAGAFLRWLEVRTGNLLDRLDVWAGLRHIAETLVRERTLSGRRAREVYAEGVLSAVGKGKKAGGA